MSVHVSLFLLFFICQGPVDVGLHQSRWAQGLHKWLWKSPYAVARCSSAALIREKQPSSCPSLSRCAVCSRGFLTCVCLLDFPRTTNMLPSAVHLFHRWDWLHPGGVALRRLHRVWGPQWREELPRVLWQPVPVWEWTVHRQCPALQWGSQLSGQLRREELRRYRGCCQVGWKHACRRDTVLLLSRIWKGPRFF